METANVKRKKSAMRFLTTIPLNMEEVIRLRRECVTERRSTEAKDIEVDIARGNRERTSSLSEKEKLLLSKSNISSQHKMQYENTKKLQKQQRYLQVVQRMTHLSPKILHQKRILLVDQSANVPLAVFSVLPYKKSDKVVNSSLTVNNTRRKSKRVSGIRPLSVKSFEAIFGATLGIEGIQQPSKEDEISYKWLLEPTTNSKGQMTSELQNPEWRSGSHKTVLTFPSYMVSIIDYTKPTELKKDLNARFQEKFPQIKITLSKCRSLKQAMQRIAKSQNCDRMVLDRAHFYFDRLVLSGKVIKENRRHCAGVCLLLSAKVNSDLRSTEICQLISGIEHGLKIGRHDLVLFEFPVFAALQFFLI